MSNHAPEPWKYTEDNDYGDAYEKIVDANGDVVANNVGYYPHAVTKENQRRIVACVNACTGVPTEKLETTATMPRLATGSLANLERAIKAEEQLAAVTAQRDELKAYLDKLKSEAIPFLIACKDDSMSRNNRQNLAYEVLDE